ncbi:MAG: LamG-like jellyroll fold domain-containing protein, partial [Saprospiraceae bacterium]
MKHIVLLLLNLLAINCLIAQDTTVVQTLQWSDNFRSGSFHFPDDPNQSWRKIYLEYNMRCRNGVTCAEWDYSCNTFLTDPSRIDSTRQTFPDYVISGFSGPVFEYSSDPTFTYYRFLQHQTQFTGGTPLERTVGNGSTELAWSTVAGVHKNQFLFTASELSAAGMNAGNIEGLQLALSQAGSELGFFKIRLKSTPKTLLSDRDPDLEGFTEVYFQNTLFDNVGMLRFPFYQPFNWDGVSNLLVEWSYNGPAAANAVVFGTNAGFDAVLNNDQADYALHFGSGSYVNIPTAPLGGIATEITIALWSYGQASVLPVNSAIFEGVNAAGARAVNVHLPWSDGSVYWDCGGAGNNYDRIQKAADPASYEGRWNHWVFTKNTVTGSMKIYLNGVLWQSGTGKTIPIDFKTLILGGSNDHALSYFGKIDEFQVWDKELDAATIAAWMRQPVTPLHPDYAHLRAYYKFDTGLGTQAMDSGPAAASATISLPNWSPTRATELYKNFSTASLRPNTTFLQGNLTVSHQPIPVLDSVINARNQVLHYGLAGTDLVVLDTNFYFPAGAMNVLDPQTDTVLAQVQAPADGIIQPQNLIYYGKRAARFELLSLVTPYGNGLSLGATGKTFTFDVTDFAPVLQGDKQLSVEFGGEWQEDLDIKFVFVSGLPAKPVLDIQNVWPEGRGWYQDILDDRVFEPRSLQLSAAAQSFKLRSAVTGHGQNGEFVARQHYLNVNGGAQEFQYDVWKYCGKNPIYPQGGTWVFDRAGWCPGMATDLHEFKLDAPPGSTIGLDYGLNGTVLGDANYLVSNQLVSYGGYSHALDASIEAIMRPNDRQVEYARINPACNAPLIRVRNNGSSPVTAIRFNYQVPGGGSDTYSWTGLIAPDAQEDITLPVLSPVFWETSQVPRMFKVQIVQVNNQTDG